MKTYLRYSVALLCLVLSWSCGTFDKGIRVGSKGATEHQLLGEIAAQLLEKANFKVVRRLGLGDTGLLHSTISSREVDLYPEDSLSAVTLTMREAASMDAAAAYERIRGEFARQYGMRVLPYLGASNQTSFVILKSLAQKEGIADLSTAAASKIQWQMGMSPDFAGRGDGQSALAVSYKLQQRFGAMTLSGAELYQALKDNQINIVAGGKSDGMANDPEFQKLEDDKHVFPPSNYFLIASEALFAERPGVEAALSRMTGKISTEELSRMVREIEVGKRDIPAVAKDFLARAAI
ncbi:hypothetical protein F183_A24160 [Bryobacterales bacterium F-183]|nr:hypothetical protein F183_A24160 [Bryobacterales bacterium F-183]